MEIATDQLVPFMLMFCAACCVLLIWYSYREGDSVVGFKVIDRQSQPKAFQVSILLLGSIGLGCLALAVAMWIGLLK